MTEKKESILLQQLYKNYQHLSDFKARTSCPLSLETIRRAIYEDKPVSIPILFILVKRLGFTNQEIIQILKDAGDEDVWPLIEGGTTITESERGLLAAVSAIKDTDPQQLNLIADHIDLIGRALGLDIKEETDKLRITPKTFRGGHGKRAKKA